MLVRTVAVVLVALGVLTEARADWPATLKTVQQLEAAKKYQEAEKLLGTAIQSSGLKGSELAQALVRRARLRMEFLTQTTNAFQDAAAAIQADPKNFQGHYYRGWGHNRLREYQPAIKTLTRCIELAALFVECYFQRSFAYQALRQHSEAHADLLRVLPERANRSSVWNNYGVILRSLNRRDEAIAAFITGHMLDPSDKLLARHLSDLEVLGP
jgi:tetratricopeptide (TPR) repeat protein